MARKLIPRSQSDALLWTYAINDAMNQPGEYDGSPWETCRLDGLKFWHAPLIYSDRAFLLIGIRAKAAPAPQFRRFHQAAFHRVAMDVTELLDPLVRCTDVEVIVPSLPNALWAALDWFTPVLPAPLANYAPREPEFQRLHGGGQRALRRLAHQQMNVLGHHYVCQHYPAIAPPYSFQHFEQQVPTLRGCQQRLPVVATEGDEVQVVSAVPAFQAKGM